MKIYIRSIVALISSLHFFGCATILSGRTQTITIETNPSGARCEVLREGRVVATVENTPGAVNLDKTKHDMNVVCKKGGFADSTGNAESGNEGYTLGNIILSGGLGWAFDSAVGSDNKYPERITVNLTAPEGTGTSVNSADLEALDRLKANGLLSEKEYQAKKKLLNAKS